MVESIYFKIAYITASYLLGSIVFGYITARIYGGKGSVTKDLPGTAGTGMVIWFPACPDYFIFSYLPDDHFQDAFPAFMPGKNQVSK